jgi:Ca-activated chloride channel family protein
MMCWPGNTLRSRALLLLLLPLLFMGFYAPGIQAGAWADWWRTPDQQGRHLFDSGDFSAAAETFERAEWRGISYFKAGDFENAAAVFGRMHSAAAAYNRGNALVMLGRYDEAIESYEQALQLKPAWAEAQQNLGIARARKEMLAPPDSDEGGTGGQLEADEIVFDDSGRVNKSDQTEEVEAGAAMSDQEMRAVWLRRAQNDPAAFLRARFSYQLYRYEQKEAVDE